MRAINTHYLSIYLSAALSYKYYVQLRFQCMGKRKIEGDRKSAIV